MRGSSILFILLLCYSNLYSQQVDISSGFVQDSLSVGEEIQYWLTTRYTPENEILLPDTNYNFEPFEFIDKYYAPSRIDNNLLVDSAVYILQSFEVDRVQKLKLPAIIFMADDSSSVWSAEDSIYFRELAPMVSDTTALKANFSYQEVIRQFNTPLLLSLLGVILFVLILVYLLFGKRIRKYLMIRKLQKDYISFTDTQSSFIEKLKEDQEANTVEEAVTHWKKYLEKLEVTPITKLTTKEILALEFTSELRESLKAIDKCIFGGATSDDIYRSFQSIEDFTQHRYLVKLEELKNNGK